MVWVTDFKGPSLSRRLPSRTATGLSAAALLSMTALPAAAQSTYSAIYDFTGGKDGGTPTAGVVDVGGTLYGTVSKGALNGNGAVYKLTPGAGGSPWTDTTIFTFPGGAGGSDPVAGVVVDASGNVYGSTARGGSGSGIVYKLTPPTGSGTTYTETVLFTFSGAGGGVPNAVILDRSGSGVIYGTTSKGGTSHGVVFKLAPPAVGGGLTETVLYTFKGGGDGGTPMAGLVEDANGVLYGTTSKGSTNNSGVVFSLTPPVSNGPWTETPIYHFTGGGAGSVPMAPVLLGSGGVLYGTTSAGGGKGFGTVFSLTPGTTWTEATLYTFAGTTDGKKPLAGVIADAAGNLYGTTSAGGNAAGTGGGVAYKLTQAASPPWSQSILHIFSGGANGADPTSGLTMDASQNLFGTASKGGAGAGIVFERTH